MVEIFIKSLAGFFVTALTLIVARSVGPTFAGALGGIPIVFAVSYLLVTAQDKGADRRFLIGGVYGAIASIFFSFVLIWLNHQFPKNYWVNFFLAYFLCILLAILLVQISKSK